MSIVKIKRSDPEERRLEKVSKEPEVLNAFAVSGPIDGVVFTEEYVGGIRIKKEIPVGKGSGYNHPSLIEIEPKEEEGLEKIVNYLMDQRGVEKIWTGEEAYNPKGIIYSFLRFRGYKQLDKFEAKLFEKFGGEINRLSTYPIFRDWATDTGKIANISINPKSERLDEVYSQV